MRLAINVIEDITEIKRAAEAQRLLAEASGVLARSLDYAETLRTVAHLAVPEMADWCAVDLCRGSRESSGWRSPTRIRPDRLAEEVPRAIPASRVERA